MKATRQCNRRGCESKAAWVPVLVFTAERGQSRRFILSLAACWICRKGTSLTDLVADGGAQMKTELDAKASRIGEPLIRSVVLDWTYLNSSEDRMARKMFARQAERVS